MILTFISSTSLLAYPFVSSSPLPKFTELSVAALNVLVLVAARTHVGNFWKGKAKIPLPGVGDYNEAITKTQQVRLYMAYLSAGWILSGGLSCIF